MVDRHREGICVRGCTNKYIKISSEESGEQAAKMMLVTTLRWLMADKVRGKSA